MPVFVVLVAVVAFTEKAGAAGGAGR